LLEEIGLALPERLIAAPRVLGLDEFALRRGRRYGTLLVDADAHHIVDLLEDPSADALVEWLGKHPGTEVICRDRDGVYASAARRARPTHSRSPIGGTWSTTWQMRWSASPSGCWHRSERN
jgi:Transposase